MTDQSPAADPEALSGSDSYSRSYRLLGGIDAVLAGLVTADTTDFGDDGRSC